MGQREWRTGSHNKVRITSEDEGVGQIESRLSQRIKEWIREGVDWVSQSEDGVRGSKSGSNRARIGSGDQGVGQR